MSRTLNVLLCGGLLCGSLVAACGAPASQSSQSSLSSESSESPSGTGPGVARPTETAVKRPGRHHHAIRTSSAEAQAAFDDGMTYVFGFNHEEAIRSFETAARIDPAAAMPHWGIAWALGPNYNLDIDDPRSQQAYAEVQKAQALAAAGPENETAYIAVFAGRYSPDPKADRAALARRYSEAMHALMTRYPDDLDAATLYAESLMNLRPWKLWTLDGKAEEGTAEIQAVLESVLARDANHIGANHYYIHTLEASPNAAAALPSAKRLDTLVPDMGHLVHMPAHIYGRTGDHAEAARANRAGANADLAYFKAGGPRGTFYEMGYYAHNLHFLVDSEMMQGRFAAARQSASELSEALSPHLDMMPMAESMAASPLSVLMRFGRADDILALGAPAKERPVLTAWWHFARGVAFATRRQVNEATAERAALRQSAAQVPESALFGGTGLTSAANILALATTVLDARIADAAGRQDEALVLWRRAVAAGDQVPYDEPPIWFYPLRESLGGALLRRGDAAAAEQVFRDALVKSPRDPRALFGLRESLSSQKKSFTDESAAFDAAWKNADSQLSVDGL